MIASPDHQLGRGSWHADQEVQGTAVLGEFCYKGAVWCVAVKGFFQTACQTSPATKSDMKQALSSTVRGSRGHHSG